MNITKLNFSDKEFHTLVNSYLKIILFSVIIDNNIDKKELKTLFSLFTRVDLDNENITLEKFNYIWDIYFWKSNIINLNEAHFDYIRVLTLENIIFYEWEKSLSHVIQYLEKNNNLSYEDKMKQLKNNLLELKAVIDSKKDLLWDIYVNMFYFWLYFYVELIAKQAWSIFEKGIVKSERVYLDKIKEFLNVSMDLSKTEIHKNRTLILDI